MIKNYFIGFDPGGLKAFGWAVMEASNSNLKILATGVESNAKEAFDMVLSICDTEIPIAIGIDSPLFWSFDGDRKSDVFVRQLVCQNGGFSGTVSHVNSLRGACLVQGVLVGQLSSNRWPSAQITEAHPKALLTISSEVNHFLKSSNFNTEHERDAVIGAFTAYKSAMKPKNWKNLVIIEEKIYFPISDKVSYWFPKSYG